MNNERTKTAPDPDVCEHNRPLEEWCGECWVKGKTDAEAKRAAQPTNG